MPSCPELLGWARLLGLDSVPTITALQWNYAAQSLLDLVHRARLARGFYPAPFVGHTRHHSHRHRELVGCLPQRLVLAGTPRAARLVVVPGPPSCRERPEYATSLLAWNTILGRRLGRGFRLRYRRPSRWTRSRRPSLLELADEPGDDDFAEYDGVRPNLDLAAQVPAPGIDPCFLRDIAAREQQVGV